MHYMLIGGHDLSIDQPKVWAKTIVIIPNLECPTLRHSTSYKNMALYSETSLLSVYSFFHSEVEKQACLAMQRYASTSCINIDGARNCIQFLSFSEFYSSRTC